MNRMLAITRGRFRPLFVVGAIALVLALAFNGLSALDLNTGGGDDDDAYVSETSGSSAPEAPGSFGAAAGETDQSMQPPSGGTTAEGGAIADADLARNAVGGSPAEQRIIRTADVEVTVRDGVAINDALNQVRSIGSAHSGYILASNSYTDDEYEYGSITLRVPADQFDQALAELRGSDVVGKVEHEETSTQDVTGEFIDNASRLRALHATEARFLELLSEASNLDSVLRIEYELQTVRSEIETIEGRQQYLDTMTTYSTITVTLSQSGTQQIADIEEDDDSFLGRIAGDSWDNASGTMESLLRGTITLTLVAVAMLPAAIVLLLLYRGFRAWQRRNERRQVTAAVGSGSGSGD